MEKQLLSDLTQEDESTIQALLEELCQLLNPGLALLRSNAYSTWYDRDTYQPPKVGNANFMRRDIGEYIMSALDVLYGSGTDGDAYLWSSYFDKNYGSNNVELMTKLGTYSKAAESIITLKWRGWISLAARHHLSFENGSETIEAIDIRVDALESVFSKYEKMSVWAYRSRMLEYLRGELDSWHGI